MHGAYGQPMHLWTRNCEGNTMAVNSEQLEAEADALIKQLNEPPAKPDTETEDPPADVEAGKQDEEEAEAPAPDDKNEQSPAEADTDELDGLSLENAAERIRNAQARMTRATTEAANHRRALTDAQLRSQQLEEEVERLQSELQAAKAASPGKPDTTQDGMATLETLQEDYPQIIGPLIAALKGMREKVDKIEGTVTTRDDSAKAERARDATEKHFNAIRGAHSDFDQVVNSDEFNGWVSRQSRVTSIILYGDGVQGSGYRNGGNAAEVIEVLDTYKKAIGSAARTGAAREAAAPTLRKTTRTQPQGRPTFTREQIDAMSPAEFAKNEAAIDEALAAGRVT